MVPLRTAATANFTTTAANISINDSRVNVADALDGGQPSLAASTESVHSTPHTVSEVEPDSAEPHEVKHSIDGIGKRVLDPVIAVGGVELIAHVCQFDKHHFGPEIVEVQAGVRGRQ